MNYGSTFTNKKHFKAPVTFVNEILGNRIGQEITKNLNNGSLVAEMLKDPDGNDVYVLRLEIQQD